jgi:lipopolysaccharide exporter
MRLKAITRSESPGETRVKFTMPETVPISQVPESPDIVPVASQTQIGFVRRLIARTRRWDFARNAALLSIGTAAAQGFSMLAAPVLTRVYAATDIGQWALFTSFISVASVCVSLKYEIGIVSAKDEPEAARLTYASVLLSLPLSILGGLALYLAIRLSWFGFGALPEYATLLIIPSLFLTGAFAALRYWSIRQGEFGLISKTIVGQHASRALSQVSFGLVRAASSGLMVGELLGRAVGVTPLFRREWPKIYPHMTSVSVRDLLRTLNVNRKLVVYSLPSTFIDTLVSNLPIPLVVGMYGLEAGGYFALVQRVLAVPLGLIAASVADTFHGSLATCARESPHQMVALFKRTSIWLFLIGLVPTLILIGCGKSLFQIIFGNQWALAGTLAAISAPWFLTGFVVSPLSRLVFVLHGQELKLIYDIGILASMLAVAWLSFHRHLSLVQTAWAFSSVNTLAYLIYYLVLLRIILRSSHLRTILSAQ